MNDRDSLLELFEIVKKIAIKKNFKTSLTALSFYEKSIGGRGDVFLRRRLSVARMVLDFHLSETNEMMDSLITAALSNSMPGDTMPEGFGDAVYKLLEKNPMAKEVFLDLHQLDYRDASYYDRIVLNKYALLIRLTERGVLFETLYEWSALEAREFIRQTRENFFTMCIYGKEHYPEFEGAFTVLIEKTRNLLSANEGMLNRYEEISNNLDLEILSLTEENSLIKRIIKEYEKTS